jgi:phosphatidylglycerophosphate synthase
MFRLKAIADALTWFRFALGPGLVALGAWGGAGAIDLAARAVLAGWASDALDGPLARRDPKASPSWIGRNDLLVDVCFSLGVWLYLALSGWVSPTGAGIYVLLAALAIWQTRSVQLAWGVQALPYAGMGVVALRVVPRVGWMYVAYVVGVVAITWPRIPRRIGIFVRALLRGFRSGDTAEPGARDG